MAAKKTSARKGGRKYSTGASKSVKSAMGRRKRGTLRRGKSGHGGKVKSRKQAIAIGLAEARREGDKVPPRKPANKTASKPAKRAAKKRATKRPARKATKQPAKKSAKKAPRRSAKRAASKSK
jgi:hypothetical protein